MQRAAFDLMVRMSEALRRKDPRADGRRFWNDVKASISDSVLDIPEERNWSRRADMTERIARIRARYGPLEGQGDEVAHFAMQLVRIPEESAPTRFKVLQLALNAGQYIGSVGSVVSTSTCDPDVASIIERLHEVLPAREDDACDAIVYERLKRMSIRSDL